MKKILAVVGILCLSHAAYARDILTIVPSITNTTIRSDSETMVTYNVTNTANAPVSNVVVQQPIATSGKSALLSLQTNTCTGILAAGASCSFQLLISGSNANQQQPSNFTISPEICGFGGSLCVGPTQSNTLNVQTYNITNTPFAYLGILGSGANQNNLVPVNSSLLSVGTPASVNYNYQTSSDNSPVTVSLDGTRVYTLEPESGNVVVLSSGATPQVLATIPLDLPGGGSFAYVSIAVTPDGKTIYLGGSNNDGGIIYVIHNNQGTYTLGAPITGFGLVGGLAISPDGKTLYATDYFNGEGNNGVFYAYNIQNNNSLIASLDNSNSGCHLQNANMLAVTPDNQNIYIQNQGGTEGVQQITNNHGAYACSTYISAVTDQTSSIAVSPNGKYLYLPAVTPQIYTINTATNAIATYSLPSDSIPFGISVTPNGQRLFISSQVNQLGDSGANTYTVSLSNGLPSGDVTAIDVGGPQNTLGQFVN